MSFELFARDYIIKALWIITEVIEFYASFLRLRVCILYTFV